MIKLDLKRELAPLYGPSATAVSVIDVPPLAFIMLDGAGDPNTAPEYVQALEALYGLAYTVKFACKKQLETDYVVPPLEGLWWTPDMAEFSMDAKQAWQWTMMIMQPAVVTAELVAASLAELHRKKPGPGLDKVRYGIYHEGLCVQIMHIGPYAAEGPTIARLHAYAAEHGYALAGKHHEIYLGDPRRSAPEKLKTVLRQPVSKL
jgi:hypothetical protein